MRTKYLLLAFALLGSTVFYPLSAKAQKRSKSTTVYYPAAGNWQQKAPEALGVNADLLREAIAYAQAQESDNPRDLEHNHYTRGFGKEPFGDGIGPFKTRGDATGLIIKDGYIIGQWGDPSRVDMTFSVTKSFLSSTVGLAWDQGIISDLDAPVAPMMAPVVPFAPYNLAQNKSAGWDAPDVLPLFEGAHNQQITWEHLLRQTSDWQGTLWGKPDWADRPQGEPATWTSRERHTPGSVYKYNDVRVNLLALAIQNLWRQPLPQVLKARVMDPIGASPTWRWHGYENSWIVMDGQPQQAVSGGGHWGGGMFISALDQARFGYLTLRKGRWQDQQILSEAWLKLATTPGMANPNYGYMNFFLHTNQESLITAAPATAFAHLGAGTNMVYVDREHDLVIVARWIKRDALNGLIKRVLESIE